MRMLTTAKPNVRAEQNIFLEYRVCLGNPLLPKSATDLAVCTGSVSISNGMKWNISSPTYESNDLDIYTVFMLYNVTILYCNMGAPLGPPVPYMICNNSSAINKSEYSVVRFTDTSKYEYNDVLTRGEAHIYSSAALKHMYRETLCI